MKHKRHQEVIYLPVENCGQFCVELSRGVHSKQKGGRTASKCNSQEIIDIVIANGKLEKLQSFLHKSKHD